MNSIAKFLTLGSNTAFYICMTSDVTPTLQSYITPLTAKRTGFWVPISAHFTLSSASVWLLTSYHHFSFTLHHRRQKKVCLSDKHVCLFSMDVASINVALLFKRKTSLLVRHVNVSFTSSSTTILTSMTMYSYTIFHWHANRLKSECARVIQCLCERINDISTERSDVIWH